MVQITKTLGVAALVAGMAMGSSMTEDYNLGTEVEGGMTSRLTDLYENDIKKDFSNYSNTDSPMETIVNKEEESTATETQDDVTTETNVNKEEESIAQEEYDAIMDFFKELEDFEATPIYVLEDELFEDIDMVLEEEVMEEIAQGVENFIQDVVENIPKEVSEQMADIGNDFEALFGKLEQSQPKNFEEVIENLKTAEEFEEYAAKVQEELPEETKEQIKAFEEKTTKFVEEGLKMFEEFLTTAEDNVENTEDNVEETEDNVEETVEAKDDEIVGEETEEQL